MGEIRQTAEAVHGTITLVACPECGSTAEVTDRRVLDSTDGPIEHGRVRCVDGHWFLMPLEGLVGDLV